MQDDRLALAEEAQAGEVTDRRRGDGRVVGEIEVLQRGGLLEAGGADPADDGGRLSAGDLVVAERLEELEVTEVPGSGLSEAGVEGVQHARQLQGA